MADTLKLHVEIFAGSKIETACEDLVALARLLGVHVFADFNGVRLCADPREGDATALHENWKRQIARPDGPGVCRFANSHRSALQ